MLESPTMPAAGHGRPARPRRTSGKPIQAQGVWHGSVRRADAPTAGKAPPHRPRNHLEFGEKMLRWMSRNLWQSAEKRTDLSFVLYTRAGCPLCEKAEKVLRQAQRAFHFPLEIVDIKSDGDLSARYGDCVPVVTVNGKLRFRGA